MTSMASGITEFESRGRILSEISAFISEHAERNGTRYWREPIVGYADPDSPMVTGLRDIVRKDHLMPNDILEGAVSIISYFIPFREDVTEGNIPGTPPSEMWVRSYVATNDMAARLNEHMTAVIGKMGYRASYPKDAGMTDDLRSRWSQRHIARAAGLGTFGLNNMLISERGCGGRYFSIVTDMPFTPDAPAGEACLHKRDGSCGICVSRCIPNALTRDGFDRAECKRHMDGMGSDADVCGKCVVGLPCTSRRP